jgi:plasmid stabilization system protein ParE
MKAGSAALSSASKMKFEPPCERISGNALMFPAIDNRVRRALLRSFPYSVYFMVEAKGVVILAVLHQHRHPDSWRTRS